MRKFEIKIGLILLSLVSFFTLLSFYQVYANDDDISISFYDGIMFSQNFEGEFPPDGWYIETPIASNDWNQVEISPDGEYETYDGDRFVCAIGDSSFLPTSTLISEYFNYKDVIETTDDCDWGEYQLTFLGLSSVPDDLTGFNIKTTSGYPAYKNSICSGDGTGWANCYLEFSFSTLTDGTISFEYSGPDDSYMCLDKVKLSYACEVTHKNKKESTSDDGCGCTSTNTRSSISTTLVMLIIAIFAIITNRIKRFLCRQL